VPIRWNVQQRRLRSRVLNYEVVASIAVAYRLLFDLQNQKCILIVPNGTSLCTVSMMYFKFNACETNERFTQPVASSPIEIHGQWFFFCMFVHRRTVNLPCSLQP
jgi:hypothetical protein